jgi:hypothetical protein
VFGAPTPPLEKRSVGSIDALPDPHGGDEHGGDEHGGDEHDGDEHDGDEHDREERASHERRFSTGPHAPVLPRPECESRYFGILQ